MSDENDSMELRLDESNELFFKISVFGAERSPDAIRLVCEAGDLSYAFKGKTTTEDGIVCFVVPAMKNTIKAGIYEARVEVIVDNHYFVPVKFNADFKQPMKVVAESVTHATSYKKEEPKLAVKAAVVTKPISLREKYQQTKK